MPGDYPTPADTKGELDWDKVMQLSWRPAWSIRSRQGSISLIFSIARAWLERRRTR